MSAPTNRQVADILLDAIVKLLLSYDAASPKDKALVTKSLNVLYAEYARVTGSPGLASYVDVSGALTKSSGSLRKVQENAEALANAMVSATQIIGAITKLLGLIG